jgi:AcrR family transcriptional regulator
MRAAYNQIAERGFEGLRTREVAAEAGVNIATLHYYFPTKEALILGVVEQTMGFFRSTLEPHGSPTNQLQNHLRAVRRLLEEQPQLGLVMGELALRSARDPALARTMQDVYALWHKTVRALLKRAAKEGSLPRAHDTDEVASIIIATLTAMTLPTVSGGPHDEEALNQLERWLEINPKKPSN